MALRHVYSPSWTAANADRRRSNEFSFGPTGAADARVCGSILNAIRSPSMLISSIPARMFGPAQFCCTLRAEEEMQFNNRSQLPLAHRRRNSGQSKEINKQDGPCIAHGPGPVSALRFLPGAFVSQEARHGNA